AEKSLSRLKSLTFADADELIRLHETLLFLRAYPGSPRVAKLSEALLRTFSERIEKLEDAEIDTSALDHPDVSGFAGTTVIDTFSFNIVRWLLSRYPRQTAFY